MSHLAPKFFFLVHRCPRHLVSYLIHVPTFTNLHRWTNDRINVVDIERLVAVGVWISYDTKVGGTLTWSITWIVLVCSYVQVRDGRDIDEMQH